MTASATVSSLASWIFTQAPIRRVVVCGGTHGNEYTGVWCIKSLEKTRTTSLQQFPSLDISTLLTNPRSFAENKRFVSTDLNREFSERKFLSEKREKTVGDGVETLRAKELDDILGPKFGSDPPKADVVVDLHTTTCNMGTCLIIPEGDVLMAQAAAYVLSDIKSGGKEGDDENVRCLVHSLSKSNRPNLASTGKHGFTIEVGPVPQGLLRWDAIERTNRVLFSLLTFLHRVNLKEDVGLEQHFPSLKVPCYQSAPAVLPGEISGKIVWPCDAENPNFPSVVVHPSIQDRDFCVVKRGDPLFIGLDGGVINYDGSHGEEVHLIFVNEGGYYYESSGTGIGVAVKAEYDLRDGKIVR